MNSPLKELEALATPGAYRPAASVERRWGELLRSEPHIRELISRGLQGGSLVPLRSVATVRGGVVTRANSFFIVEEVLFEEIPPEFNVTRRDLARVAVVKDGLGTLHRLERAWLRPVIKGPERLLSPTEVSESRERLLVVDLDKDRLRRQQATGVLSYLKRGETLSYKVSRDDLKGGIPALRSNIRNRRPYWYSLSIPEVRGARILMPEHLDPRYVATLLPESNTAVVIDKIFIIAPLDNESAPVLLASLNALLTWYQIELRGRTQLGQGVLELKIPDIEGLAVLNPGGLSKKGHKALLEAFSPLERAREPDSLEAAVKPERVAFDELYLQHAGSSAPEEDRLHVERELRAAAAERHERRQSVASEKIERRRAGRSAESVDAYAARLVSQVEPYPDPRTFVRKGARRVSIPIQGPVEGPLSTGTDLSNRMEVFSGSSRIATAPSNLGAQYVEAVLRHDPELQHVELPQEPALSEAMRRWEQASTQWGQTFDKAVESVLGTLVDTRLKTEIREEALQLLHAR